MKLIFRVNDFPYSIVWQFSNAIYLAWKHFSFDFLMQHTSLANDTSHMFNHWVAWTFRSSGDKGMGHWGSLVTAASIFQSSTACTQAAVFTQTHHTTLILKSRFSKHQRWETRRQVWQCTFWSFKFFKLCSCAILFLSSVSNHVNKPFNSLCSLF